MAPPKSDKLSASLEDYLEAIFNLAGESDVARSKDIAKLLGVSKSSVTGALRSLRQKKLVNHKPYDSVTLTKDGQAAAAEVVRKHNILKAFFVDVLGIDARIAQQAACKAEHALGMEVIARLLAFIKFVTRESKNGYDLASRFSKFCKDNSRDKRGTKAKN